MEIVLEQHCFTSADPEFETVGMSKCITEEQKLLLEKHSVYFLPGNLLYDDKAVKPVKYVFYPLLNDKFVMGRAEYTGKDTLGRPGNYFFHNYIISRQDLWKINANPTPLIRSLIKENQFKNSLPHSLQPLSYSFNIKDSFTPVPEKLNREALAALLYFSNAYHEDNYPVIFHGATEEILQYLDLLFSLLPYEERMWVSFDTYAFGIPYSFMFLGIPENPAYSHSVFSAYEYYLSSGKSRVIREYKVSAAQSTLVDFLFAGKQAVIEQLFSFLDSFKRSPDRFLKLITDCDDDFLSLFYGYAQNQLIQFILKTANIALLNIFKEFLTQQDLNIIFSAPGLIDYLTQSPYKELQQRVLNWILHKKQPKAYGIILKKQTLWKLFKQVVDTSAKREFTLPLVKILLILLEICREYHKAEYEKYLLKKILLSGQNINKQDIYKKVYNICKKFPQTSDNEILFLRSFYRMWRKNKIADAFFGFDFTRYDRELRQIFLYYIVGIVKNSGLKKISSLACHLKGVLSDIKSVIDFTEQNCMVFLAGNEKMRDFLSKLRLLNLMEKIFVSSQSYERLKYFIECLRV